MKVRISCASTGGQIVTQNFCDNDKHDVAEVLQAQHVAVDNQQVYLNGNLAELNAKVKDGDIVSLQKQSSKSGR